MPEEQNGSSNNSAYYAPYAEYSKTVRTWFVAYGIGAPVVLLSSDTAWKAIVDANCGESIGFFFLTGVALQLVAALLNKHAMWNMYFQEASLEFATPLNPPYWDRWIYKISEWYSEQNWVDVLLDLYSLILFGWATRLAFLILSNQAGKKVCFQDDLWLYRTITFIIMSLVFVGWFLMRYIPACRQGRFKKSAQTPNVTPTRDI